jgi:hypothetical protein
VLLPGREDENWGFWNNYKSLCSWYHLVLSNRVKTNAIIIIVFLSTQLEWLKHSLSTLNSIWLISNSHTTSSLPKLHLFQVSQIYLPKKSWGKKCKYLILLYFTNYTYQARYNEVLLGKLNLKSSSLSFSKTLLQCQGVHHHQLLKQQTQHTSPFQ